MSYLIQSKKELTPENLHENALVIYEVISDDDKGTDIIKDALNESNSEQALFHYHLADADVAKNLKDSGVPVISIYHFVNRNSPAFTTRFTNYPIGLGIHKLEMEETVAHHWNQCVEQAIHPSVPISVSEVRKRNLGAVNYHNGRHRERVGSLLQLGYAIEVNGKYALTEKAIKKCVKYLGL